jgi:hypothetical protein
MSKRALVVAVVLAGCLTACTTPRSGGGLEPATSTKTAVKVVSGPGNGCAIRSGGALECWGEGPALLKQNSWAIPVPIDLGAPVTDVAIVGGASALCGVLTNGTVKCQGGNNYGNLGTGSEDSTQPMGPVAVPGLTDVESITAGSDTICAIRTDHTVWCWGDDPGGNLAYVAHPSESPIELAVGPVTQVAVGVTHTCVLTTTQTVECAGSNVYGQLGQGNLGGFTTTWTPVVGLSNVVEIAADGWHTCARTSDGAVKCWGNGEELGNGSSTNSGTPVDLPGIANATAISGNCAIVAGGTVSCWGQFVGDGTQDNHLTPFVVPLDGPAVRVTQQQADKCVRLAAGALRCWGLDTGSATMYYSWSPIAVYGYE